MVRWKGRRAPRLHDPRRTISPHSGTPRAPRNRGCSFAPGPGAERRILLRSPPLTVTSRGTNRVLLRVPSRRRASPRGSPRRSGRAPRRPGAPTRKAGSARRNRARRSTALRILGRLLGQRTASSGEIGRGRLAVLRALEARRRHGAAASAAAKARKPRTAKARAPPSIAAPGRADGRKARRSAGWSAPASRSTTWPRCPARNGDQPVRGGHRRGRCGGSAALRVR